MSTKIKELRINAKLTQEYVAHAAGLTATGFRNIESGKTKLLDCKHRTVIKLAGILGEEIYKIAIEEETTD